jgi:hypothetical protein
MPDFRKNRMISHDDAKCGAGAGRRRLIARRDQEVNTLPG